MQRHIQKWGNSLGIRIPKQFAKQLHLHPGSPVHLEIEDGKLIVHSPQYNLEDLLKEITPKNQHKLLNDDLAKGNRRMVKYSPSRGDVIWLEFDPQKGKEIQKTRPALVISPQAYNMKTGIGLFGPITSKIKGYPFEVTIEFVGIHGAVLSDQIKFLDWRARKAKLITRLPIEIVEDVLAKLKTLLN